MKCGDNKPRRVLLVDDHPIVRRGLAELIGSDPTLEVGGEAAGVRAALDRLAEAHFDALLVDLALGQGHGFDLIREVRRREPDLAMLVVSIHDDALYAERALRAGARGYINKAEGLERICEAVHSVLRGEIWLSRPMSARLLQTFAASRSAAEDLVGSLSDRELQVFEMIGRGMATKEIARRLQVSPKTIDTHRERVKRKMHFDNSSELMCRAVEWSLHHAAGAGR